MGDLKSELARVAQQRAKQAFDQGDFEDALAWLERTGAGASTSPLAGTLRYRLALRAIAKHQFNQAESHLRRVGSDPGVPRWLIDERLRLIRARPSSTSDLRGLQSRIGKQCTKCEGLDLYAAASCLYHHQPVPPATKLHPANLQPAVEAVYAPWAYRPGWDPERGDPLTRLVQQEKRSIDRPVLRFLGAILADYLRAHTPMFEHIDALVHVPTSGERDEARGGSIPLVLAEAIRDDLAVPMRRSITCVTEYSRHGDPPYERELALRRALRVVPDSVLAGRSVLLIDDIITTGTTLKTVATMLSESGIGAVFALALCHTERSTSY